MKKWLLLLAVLLAICPASAIVTTGGASGTTGNSTILHGTGCSGSVCWFEYGLSSGTYYPWRSYNATAVGGVFSMEIAGLPLIGGQTVYYAAVDANGDRGAEATVAILPVTQWVEPTYGQHLANITRYRYGIPIISQELGGPYFDVTPIMVFSGLMFFFVFAGIWISGRSTLYPSVIFGATSFLIFTVTPGIAPEIVQIAQGIFIASIAGIVFFIFKR